MSRRIPPLHWLVALFSLLWLPQCQPDSNAPGGADPVEAIATLNAHLIANDLAAFARDAVPPELSSQLAIAWQTGQTRWPLDELPLSSQYPQVLAALAAEDAGDTLLSRFDSEVAGTEAGLRQMAHLLTIFVLEFVSQQGQFSPSERAHYQQLLHALDAWAARAPLTDRKRAEQALDMLMPAAREAALITDMDFARIGMQTALQRMIPLVAASKQVLALYGLDLNAALEGMQLQWISGHGDDAQVRMHYSLAGNQLDVDIPMRRIDDRWYVADFVDNASAAVATLQLPSITDNPEDSSHHMRQK